jgi:preprotein translocase subunit Sec61beta
MGISSGGQHMAKKDTSGLMSSAGIMRYFEAEESAIKIDPVYVVAACIVFGAIVWVLNFHFGRLW